MGVLTDQMRDDIERLIDERDEAVAEVERLRGMCVEAAEALDGTYHGVNPEAVRALLLSAAKTPRQDEGNHA